MKIHSALAGALFLMLNLCACGSTRPQLSEDMISEIYTAAVKTALAQSNPLIGETPLELTPTPAPTDNPTSYPSPTAYQYASPYPTLDTGGCDRSAYISDVNIPDGTVLAPGDEFVKSWRFQNIGSCTWSGNYSIAFMSGEAMGGSSTDIDKSVASGESAEVSISFIAPETEGTYTGYWVMMNTQGIMFGEQVYVQIVVAGEAATETPTSTATEQPANTRTPTPSPTATETPIPTDPPTAVPTESSTPEAECLIV